MSLIIIPLFLPKELTPAWTMLSISAVHGRRTQSQSYCFFGYVLNADSDNLSIGLSSRTQSSKLLLTPHSGPSGMREMSAPRIFCSPITTPKEWVMFLLTHPFTDWHWHRYPPLALHSLRSSVTTRLQRTALRAQSGLTTLTGLMLNTCKICSWIALVHWIFDMHWKKFIFILFMLTCAKIWSAVCLKLSPLILSSIHWVRFFWARYVFVSATFFDFP